MVRYKRGWTKKEKKECSDVEGLVQELGCTHNPEE
jgi:hypothetical protein